MTPNYPGDDVARAAFDVMMRRGWHVDRSANGHWGIPLSLRSVAEGKLWNALGGKVWSDPFTALVEMDTWYKEHLEAELDGHPVKHEEIELPFIWLAPFVGLVLAGLSLVA